MNIKNYTSNVPAMTTINYIEAYLMDCGATNIAKEIKANQVAAIYFEVFAEGRLSVIKLPANIDQVHEWLWRDYVAGMKNPRKTKDDFKDQASRTAWKIMQDWVQVQMSIVKLRQAELMQVFLPYIWNGNQTYYEYLKESKFKALPAPSQS